MALGRGPGPVVKMGYVERSTKVLSLGGLFVLPMTSLPLLLPPQACLLISDEGVEDGQI